MRNPITRIAGAVRGAWRAMNSFEERWAAGEEIGLLTRWGAQTHAGVHVTHDSAMQVDAVWACIDVIASACSSTDWNVYEGISGADKKTAVRPDDMLQYVLNSRFNPQMTAQAGKRALMISAVGFGNGCAEIQRDQAGRIIALWPLCPTDVEVRKYTDNGEVFYRFHRDGGRFVDLAAEDVFHIRGAGLTGFAGDDPVSRAIQSIASAIALDQFAAAYFANGAQPGVVVEVPGLKKLPEPEYNRLKEQWAQRHQGARNSFRVGFVDSSMKVSKVGDVDADKAQMVEAKYLSVETICRWFRVPPHKVAHLLRATFNNIEHLGLEFSRDTVRPWKMEIEQECDWSLIPARGTRKFVELDVDWMEQGDFGARMTAFSTGRGMGVYTVNDVLRKLGENTIGPEGDIRTMNGAAVKLEDVGKNMLPAPTKPAAPAEPVPTPPASNALQSWAQSIYADMADRYRLRMFRDGARANAKELARKDAAEYLATRWKAIAPEIERERPDIGYVAAMDMGSAVIDGKGAADAVCELFEVIEEEVSA